jgi:hypothetical protein
MKRLITILSVIAVLAIPAGSFAQASPYAWTISASLGSPYVNTLGAAGIQHAYLWLACCQLPAGIPQGGSAAEFRLVATAPNLILGSSPVVGSGFLNAGTLDDLLLAMGGCPCGPIAGMDLTLFIQGPGTISLAPSNRTPPRKVTVDCRAAPTTWPIDWIGLGIMGMAPPGKGLPCQFVSVEESTWGQIKGLYR